MSAKKVVELSYELYEAKEKLVESQKRVSQLIHRLASLEEEIQDVRLENEKLRPVLLCDACREYLESKRPGDTIEAGACTECIGIF